MSHQLVRPQPLDIFILVLLSVIWGSAFGAIKIALNDMQPFSLVAARAFIGFVALAVFLLVSGQFKISWRNLPYRRLLAIAFIGTMVPFFLISWAEQYVDSSVAGLFNGVGPLVAIIGGHFITRDELMTKERVIGVLVGMVGVALLMQEGFSQIGHNSLIAQFALIIAFSCYIAGSLMVRGQKALSATQLTCFSLAIGSIFFVPLSIFVDSVRPMEWSPSAWVAILWLSLVSTAFAISLRYILVNRMGAGFTANVGFLIPMVAVAIGFFLGEQISLIKLIAMGTIVISLYIARQAGTKLRVR